MTIPPIVSIDYQNVSKREVLDFLPAYTLESANISVGKLRLWLYGISISFIKLFIKIRLKALGYKKFFVSLTQEDIDSIYTREAKSYEWKHHATTNFRDTWWRRSLGFDVVNHYRRSTGNQKKAVILDIGTGIGLSLEEMFRVFKYTNTPVFAYGLDFNKAMLREANQVILPRMKGQGLLSKNREVKFLRGDGKNLTGSKGEQKSILHLENNSIDCVTIMFGIGGIDLPYDSFEQQLAVLREGGISVTIDIHRPFVFLENHWPWYLSLFNHKVLEFLAWERGTIPLVLRSIWGWEDPTTIFYKAPLVTYHDKRANTYFGFRIFELSYANEPWWFGLPFTNTAKLIMEKVSVSKEEFDKRRRILSAII